MARPKEYNRSAVLDSATELFWQKGYHGTSLSELVSATGLNKQSMYQEFGNKAGLFQACLNHYKSIMGKKVIGILTKAPLSTANIRDLFEYQLEYVKTPGANGCLFINSANEREHLHESAITEIDEFFKRIEEHFYSCLITSFSKNESRSRAAFFVTVFAGIMTVSKTSQRDSLTKNYLKIILQSLET